MSEPTSAPVDSNPMRNPSYPQRTHIRERAKWQSVLTDWDAKIAAAQGRAKSSPNAHRVLVQMAGARDQIADSVKRLCMEVGEMYAEDKHKLEEAVAALERLMVQF